jgi:hypothetical protein
MNWLQCVGWNSVAVMTSVNSSMFTGLISTMSAAQSLSASNNIINNKNLWGRTEALITDIEVPQIYSQVVGRYVGLLIRIDRDRMDVICMCI